MNANSVLGKIMTLLSVEKVAFTYAKLEDGTIVESPTFDVGEPVEVVTEDGKSPAPDGEHELFLRDEEGNEVRIRVITKDGIITERENVEEMEEETKEEKDIKTEDMSEETLEPQPLPGEPGYEEMKVKMEDYGKKMEDMAYRIEELEKAVKQYMQEEIVEEDDIEEVAPMNGAPVEMSKASNLNKNPKKDKVRDAQSSFLSKLYK
jgi:hypothetical protein